MKRACQIAVVAIFAAQAFVLGQGNDAAKILAQAKGAIGGEKLAAATSLVATGHTVKFTTGAATDSSDFEMAMELPDKFFKKEVIAVLGDNTISRTSGFNGDELIEAIETPPGLFGGGNGSGRMMIRSTDGVTNFGNMAAPPGPEAAAAARKASVLAVKQDFARLTLGLFATSFSGYPLEFAMDAPATAADGKASVISIKGEGDFVAKLFVDRESHLPVKLTWMAKEPIARNSAMRTGGSGVGNVSMGGGTTVVSAGGGQTTVQGNQALASLTPEDRAQMMKDLEMQAKEAEARRRVVEFQMTYSDYKVVNGVNMPTHFRRTIDGRNIDELVLDKITLNAKIDPKKFDVVK